MQNVQLCTPERDPIFMLLRPGGGSPWRKRGRWLTRGWSAATAAAALALSTLTLIAAQQRQVVERVEVARVLIDARVIDDDGWPVLGLEPADFEVEIDGTPVRVESVQWVGDDAARNEPLASRDLVGVVEPASRGRLIVILVQKSLERQRAVGLLRVLRDSSRLLARLTREDRVAILSFDSHLKIWLDFTRDLDRVRAVMAQDVMFKRPPALSPLADAGEAGSGPAPEPSLLARLSQQRGRTTYKIEEALRLLGNALEPLPGAKSVVLVGYGLGQLTVTLGMVGARLEPGYEDARAALQAARAAVFCLDVTDADYHTFELGLQTVAADTGGFFARTNLYAQHAVDRVANALVGHYVLFAEKPQVESGTHRITVRLTRDEGTVFARSSYVD